MRHLLLSCFAVALLNAGTYTHETYSLTNAAQETNADASLKGRQFERIVRFEALNYADGSLEADGGTRISEIAEKIKAFDASGKERIVTVIGHTQARTDDRAEAAVASQSYGSLMDAWFEPSLDTKTSADRSRSYADEVAKKLRDAGVDEKILQVEERSAFDPACTDATTEGLEGSNRVMVALYVMKSTVVDSDGDGVPDEADRCPQTPSGIAVDAAGCPLDEDRDGVYDALDKCPHTPAGVAVDAKGCPLDEDRDGVYDALDQCPHTPAGTAVDAKGCPLDEDQDGVLDADDRCPGTPRSFKVDSDGCPQSRELMLTFETNSYTIDSASYPEVVDFAAFLKANPLYKAQIVGHTDSVGKAAANMTLSVNRAKAAEAALVREGVAADRLSSTGRGELEPVASNRTPEGRQANRRIEVRLSR